MAQGRSIDPILHLSLPVRDLAESKRFYQDAFGCEIGRELEGWLDVWFFGLQLTLHEAPDQLDSGKAPGHRHFGVALEASELDELIGRLERHGVAWVLAPRVDFAGTEREQRKAKLADPSGHVVEIKTYPNPGAALAP